VGPRTPLGPCGDVGDLGSQIVEAASARQPAQDPPGVIPGQAVVAAPLDVQRRQVQAERAGRSREQVLGQAADDEAVELLMRRAGQSAHDGIRPALHGVVHMLKYKGKRYRKRDV